MYLQLRELFFHANELLLGRQKAFQGLAVLVVAGTMAEGAGIALIMPLMVAIQGGEVVLPHWLGPLSQVELTNPAATLAGLVAAAFVVKNGLAFIRLRWSLLLSFGLWQKWVRLAVDNIIYAPVDPGDKRKPGVLVSTILVETKHSARVLLNVLDLLVSFFTFVCIYAVLFLASWRVTLALTVLITLIVVTGLRPLTRASHESGVRAVRSMGTTSNFLLEILGGISYLKAFGREDYFAAQMGEASDGCGKAFIKSRWLANFVGPLIETIFVLLFCSAIVVSSRGGGGVLATYLPLIGLFSAAAFRLFPVLSGVGREWVLIISNQPSVCRVAEQIRARPRESMGVRPFRELSTSIVFRGVGYEYPDRPPALVDLSVDLARGSRTVLVGESGSGKTTAVALLLGFLRPSTGDIVVDGINLRDLELNTWRRGIGFVGQEGFIFHTTIAENISLGRIPEDDSRIEEVCQVVGLRQFISTVPHGYATLVGERGTQLSGGQRQRIALARAILMRPEILILDEAMSALDNESAVSVLQAVNDYLPESTWLVVAHRLSGIEILDPTIVVLRHGRVLEKGRHGELMERRGYYCQLFEAEAAAPVPVERPIDPVGR